MKKYATKATKHNMSTYEDDFGIPEGLQSRER